MNMELSKVFQVETNASVKVFQVGSKDVEGPIPRSQGVKEKDSKMQDQKTNQINSTKLDEDTESSNGDTKPPDVDTNSLDEDTNSPDEDTNSPNGDTNSPYKDTNYPDKDTMSSKEDIKSSDISVLPPEVIKKEREYQQMKRKRQLDNKNSSESSNPKVSNKTAGLKAKVEEKKKEYLEAIKNVENASANEDKDTMTKEIGQDQNFDSYFHEIALALLL